MMKLKEGLEVRKIELVVDPLKISFDSTLSEAKRLKERFPGSIVKFQYCGNRIVLEDQKRKA